METKLKIKVTKEILERSKMCGHTGNMLETIAENCAVALAVRDIFPNVWVERFYIKGLVKPILLPGIATNFIISFDNTTSADRPNLPEIEFEITIPDAVLEQINIEEIRPLLLNHPTLQLV